MDHGLIPWPWLIFSTACACTLDFASRLSGFQVPEASFPEHWYLTFIASHALDLPVNLISLHFTWAIFKFPPTPSDSVLSIVSFSYKSRRSCQRPERTGCPSSLSLDCLRNSQSPASDSKCLEHMDLSNPTDLASRGGYITLYRSWRFCRTTVLTYPFLSMILYADLLPTQPRPVLSPRSRSRLHSVHSWVPDGRAANKPTPNYSLRVFTISQNPNERELRR
jgi:hypothetical protein